MNIVGILKSKKFSEEIEKLSSQGHSRLYSDMISEIDKSFLEICASLPDGELRDFAQQREAVVTLLKLLMNDGE